ncbi:MAG TPA: hypothetical protein PKB06_13355, partial [Actinotalea sp.]|nr:hypothetical protein [Actinotalea sp.]
PTHIREALAKLLVPHLVAEVEAADEIATARVREVEARLAQAHAAVATLDDPTAYEAAWRAVTRDYRVLTSALVAWAASPARPAIVATARRSPALFGAIVERLAR